MGPASHPHHITVVSQLVVAASSLNVCSAKSLRCLIEPTSMTDSRQNKRVRYGKYQQAAKESVPRKRIRVR